MKIVALDGYTMNPGDNPWDDLAVLGDFTVYDRTESSQIVERAGDAEIIVTNKVPLRRSTLDALDALRFITVSATGYDIVDIDAAAEKGVPVSNVPVYGTETVAQHVLALVLELARRPAFHDEAVRQGEWNAQPHWCFWKTPLIELAGKTMGIVGFGRIGHRIGELASAFKMNVAAYDPYHGDTPGYASFSWMDLEELFEQSDFISINCNQTEDNIGFVNRRLIGLMKKTAFIINTSRGSLINEEDLAESLNNEKIAGAALDVVSKEPIESDNPMLSAKNVILTPHIAWAALDARKRLMKETVENVKAFLSGKPQNVVNLKKIK
ncbi:MAG TPA: D-2-hydroxyacid dehydrogenase [Deltaproteobacteria bacterium]|nr:D-2-hydroxyacid dehydrogenase [Deltaproteobacteria bacterium]